MKDYNSQISFAVTSQTSHSKFFLIAFGGGQIWCQLRPWKYMVGWKYSSGLSSGIITFHSAGD